jgi:hypothetical protein
MPDPLTHIPIALEIGKTRTFATAVDHPGWSRSGRDEASAIQSLYDYAPRYARVMAGAGVAFSAPSSLGDLVVVTRQAGNAATDFGVADLALPSDVEPVDADTLVRFERIMRACWAAFDAAAQGATGRELRKGPRGGGRELAKIVEHVHESDAGYIAALGGTLTPLEGADPPAAIAHLRESVIETLGAAARGEIPARGPRGGLRWTPRYFVRRLCWHVLDHVWEIEDRITHPE